MSWLKWFSLVFFSAAIVAGIHGAVDERSLVPLVTSLLGFWGVVMSVVFIVWGSRREE